MNAHTKFNSAIDYDSLWQHHTREVAWGTIALFFGILSGYAIVIISALNGQLHYGFASAVCSVLSFASFTVMHDAGHGSIFRMGSTFKPLETLLGWISSLVLLLIPYHLFQKIHDRHHAFTNEPERDPDHFSFGEKWYQILANSYWVPFQYYLMSVTTLRGQKLFRDTYPSTIAYLCLVYGSLTALTINGFGVEVLTFMVIPTAIALFFLVMFFDYVPHHPHKSLDRMHNTRIFPSKVLNILLLGQNYHLIHHMYPRLPWYQYQGVYRQILPFLEKEGAPIEDLSRLLGGPSVPNRPSLLNSPNATALGNNGRRLNMRLSVAAKARLCDDAVELKFALPSGQKLVFLSGQYLMISKWLAGEQQTRCYSICSAPGEQQLAIGIRRTDNGVVSNYINDEIRVGDELIVQGPFGEFTFPPAHNQAIKALVLVAGGSGITPILSILKTFLSEKANGIAHLFYACRNEASIMFYKQIDSLQQQYRGRLTVTYAVPGNLGGNIRSVERFDRPTLDACFGPLTKTHETTGLGSTASTPLETDFYVCGPAGLKATVCSLLEDRKVDSERIHVEEFESTLTEPEGEQFPVALNFHTGSSGNVRVASNQTVLEVAKHQNVSVPHACGDGTCGTCKMKVESGVVERIPDAIPGITAFEQDAGFTLACQCKPQGPITLSEI